MGLLSLGTPLKWSEAKQFADHVRSHGIDQFLSIYHKMKDKQKDCLLWGDEVYILRISKCTTEVEGYMERVLTQEC